MLLTSTADRSNRQTHDTKQRPDRDRRWFGNRIRVVVAARTAATIVGGRTKCRWREPMCVSGRTLKKSSRDWSAPIPVRDVEKGPPPSLSQRVTCGSKIIRSRGTRNVAEFAFHSRLSRFELGCRRIDRSRSLRANSEPSPRTRLGRTLNEREFSEGRCFENSPMLAGTSASPAARALSG